MTILTPPAVFLSPSSLTLAPIANTMSGGRSPLDGTEQTLALPGSRFGASLGWSGLGQDEWRPLLAFITALGGTAGRFAWAPPLPRRALGVAGRTNMVPNGQFIGAATGTPGTPGTGWTLSGLAGGSLAISGVGVDTDGAAYADVTASGTAANSLVARLEMSPGAAVAEGHVMSVGTTLQFVGTPTNITQVTSRIAFFTAGGAGISEVASITTTAPLSSATRRTATGPAPATTATARLRIDVRTNVGATYLVTLRIKQPQLERAAAASPYIATSGSPATVLEGPFVVAATAAGSTVALRGWAAQADAVRAGDLVSWVDASGRSRLHMATADAVAAEDGTCTLAFAPPLRRALAANTAVSFTAPTAIWRLTQNRNPMELVRGLVAGGTLEIEEALL
ncbi:hypothetical protein [Falsiroseomonas sp.]|uniref:hypothetical protein n=1 Tax=Falsiroseomonas sp. TaxID=2870721 RepID=UPI003F72CD34